jgi:hypothetical protein
MNRSPRTTGRPRTAGLIAALVLAIGVGACNRRTLGTTGSLPSGRQAVPSVPLAAPYLLTAAQIAELAHRAASDTGTPAYGPGAHPWAAYQSRPLGVLGLPPLRAAPLPAGVRELRLSAGFSMIWRPLEVLRLVDSVGVVRGELILYWGAQFDSLGHEYTMPGQDSVSRRLSGCAEPRRLARWYVCTVQFATPVSWRTVLDSLEANEVWTLNGGYESANKWARATDQARLWVELRDGVTYSTYQYYAPHHLGGEAPRKAVRILRLLGDLTQRPRAAHAAP